MSQTAKGLTDSASSPTAKFSADQLMQEFTQGQLVARVVLLQDSLETARRLYREMKGTIAQLTTDAFQARDYANTAAQELVDVKAALADAHKELRASGSPDVQVALLIGNAVLAGLGSEGIELDGGSVAAWLG